MSDQEFIEMVKNGLGRRDPGLIGYAIGQYATYCYEMPCSERGSGFSPEVLDFLLDLLRTPSFQKVSYSHCVLDIFSSDSELLTQAQKTKVVAAFEAAYPHIKSEKTLFLMTEILGHSLCGEQSCSALVNLANTRGLASLPLGLSRS